MKKGTRWTKITGFNCFLLLILFIFFTCQPAFADLVSGMDQLQTNVVSLCQPLAIIFLIIAGWQKAMGNSQLFIAALVGTLVMFAAPQIVTFVSSAFGN